MGVQKSGIKRKVGIIEEGVGRVKRVIIERGDWKGKYGGGSGRDGREGEEKERVRWGS